MRALSPLFSEFCASGVLARDAGLASVCASRRPRQNLYAVYFDNFAWTICVGVRVVFAAIWRYSVVKNIKIKNYFILVCAVYFAGGIP